MSWKEQAKLTLPSGNTVEVGGLVCYYHNGWRVGYLEEVKVKTVKIRPIKSGTKVRLLTLTLDDLKEVEG